MPNYCDYSMCVRGTKEAINEFIKVIQADYDYSENKFSFDRHLFRVFEANVNEFEEVGDAQYRAIIDGYCAWSVSCCMLNSGDYSYYHTFEQRFKESFRGTTLLQESEKLNLAIEVFSQEPGCCFSEYYLIKNGELEESDCVKFYEYCIDDYKTKEEAEKELTTVITDYEWNNRHNVPWITRGGFEWDFSL